MIVGVCPFCGADSIAWDEEGKDFHGDQHYLEPYECPCGAIYYEAMPDVDEKDVQM